MDPHLRVLVVADSAANRITDELTHAACFGSVSALRVATQEALAQALAGQRWDVVLAASTVRDLHALDIVVATRAADFDLPLIIVREHGTAKLPALALDMGIDDVVKHAGIAGAVRRALRDSDVRRRARAALAASEATRDALLRAIPDAVLRLHVDGRLLDHAGGEHDCVDWDVATIDEVLDPSDARNFRDTLRRVLATGVAETHRFGVACGGATRLIEARVARHTNDELVAVARDVSERHSLAEKAHAAQRMAAVGRLAGGMAHELNNAFTVILSCMRLAQSALSAEHEAATDVGHALRVTEQASTLTEQLLSLSGTDHDEPRVTALRPLVERQATLLPRVLPPRVRVRTSLARNLWNVHVDPTKFDQVVVNLALNARDAVPGEGNIVIEARNVIAQGGEATIPAHMPAGEYVLIVVRDDGSGISAEVQSQMFEPFFTTKAPEQGTGLGLAMVYGFLRRANGFVRVDSEPAHGTAVHVYLPRRVAGEIEETAPAVPQEAALPATPAHTVLVVDDNEAVLRTTARILRQAGYHVLEAAGGKEALEVAAGHTGPIDVLLTDVVMRGISGPETAALLCAKRAETRVVFMSGQAAGKWTRGGLPQPVRVIQKPFAVNALRDTLREVLGDA